MLEFCRLPVEDLIGVLNIDMVYREMKLGSNIRRILKTSKFIFNTYT